MDKQRREGRERKELKLENKTVGTKIYIYIFFFFFKFCYSKILSLELYCSTIAKNFAIVRFTII